MGWILLSALEYLQKENNLRSNSHLKSWSDSFHDNPKTIPFSSHIVNLVENKIQNLILGDVD